MDVCTYILVLDWPRILNAFANALDGEIFEMRLIWTPDSNRAHATAKPEELSSFPAGSTMPLDTGHTGTVESLVCLLVKP